MKTLAAHFFLCLIRSEGHEKVNFKQFWHCNKEGHRSWKRLDCREEVKESVKMNVMMTTTGCPNETSFFNMCVDRASSKRCCGDKSLLARKSSRS